MANMLLQFLVLREDEEEEEEQETVYPIEKKNSKNMGILGITEVF